MEQYQVRVIEEKEELDKKILNLIKFFETETFVKLSLDEQERMKRQAKAMTDYSIVLGERINNF